jgi:protein-S-isoprenylcysteine O-methyltransferase Ste14
MDKFKNKIPPTILTLLFLVFNYILSFNSLKIEIPYKYFFTTLLLILGLYIIIRSSRLFAKAKTSLDPLRPFKSTSLITNDIYKYSRNPMYFGHLLILLSSSVYLGNVISIIIIPLFIFIINIIQIIPEEETLKDLFGPTYDEYLSKVRRWI